MKQQPTSYTMTFSRGKFSILANSREGISSSGDRQSFIDILDWVQDDFEDNADYPCKMMVTH